MLKIYDLYGRGGKPVAAYVVAMDISSHLQLASNGENILLVTNRASNR